MRLTRRHTKSCTDGGRVQTHLSLVVAKGYAERAHGPDDGHEGLYSVAVHHGLVLLVVFRGEPALVDNPAHRQRTSGQHFVMTKSNATIPVRSYKTDSQQCGQQFWF